MSGLRKVFAYILALCIALTSVLCLPVFADITYGVINGTDVNVRTEPNTKSTTTKICKLSNCTVVVNSSVSGEVAESDGGNIWYNITTLDGAYTGYVYGKYLTVQQPTTPTEDFEQSLLKFPESYRGSLRALKAAYPNWTFVADNIPAGFDSVVDLEYQTLHRKQSAASCGTAWRSMQSGAYDWNSGNFSASNGGWCSASREVIARYMDPRNYLDANNIYVFADQSYDVNNQTKDGLRTVVNNTFLANGYGGNADAYLDDIMYAAQQTGVSPYVLAAIIISEQGVNGTSALISGQSGYYNFFNVAASGADTAAVISSGLAHAEEKGWDTRTKSIVGGAATYADGYISKGQNTYYYKDFNLVNDFPNGLWHQWAQNICDQVNQAAYLRKAYTSSGNTSAALTFRIPVFTSIPDSVATCPDQGSGLNNYYLTKLDATGLSPQFSIYNYSYSLSVSGNTTAYISLPDGASLAGDSTYVLAQGSNTVQIYIKSQTGYVGVTPYTINVTASKPCKLFLTTGNTEIIEPDPTPPPASSKGDINNDGAVDIIDAARIRMYILSMRTLTSDEFSRADINGDGAVDIIDAARIRMHILGVRNITD